MAAKRAVDGLFVVALGGILLANTGFGLPWAVWVSILSLWPVLLVSAGVDIIGNSTRQTWLRVVASLITLTALLYGAFVMTPGTWGFAWSGGSGSQRLVAFSDTRPPAPNIVAGDAVVDAGATRLTLSGGGDLVAIQGEAARSLVPSLSVTASGGVASVSVETPRGVTFGGGFSGRSHTAVQLQRNVAWRTLTCNLGATQADIDLSALQVADVTANIGASAMTVTFPAQRVTAADVSGGACSIRFRVPRGAAVTLDVQGFPVATTVPAGFDRQGGSLGSGTWRRSGTAGDVRLSVSAGAASVEVVDY